MNYYNESNIEIFQNSLYMNYNSYINLNKKKMNYKDIEGLLSKCSH